MAVHAGVDAGRAVEAAKGTLEKIVEGFNNWRKNSWVVDIAEAGAVMAAGVAATYLAPTFGIYNPAVLADPYFVGSAALFWGGIGGILASEHKGNLMGLAMAALGGVYYLPTIATAAYSGLVHYLAAGGAAVSTVMYNTGAAVAGAAGGVGPLAVAIGAAVLTYKVGMELYTWAKNGFKHAPKPTAESTPHLA
ncbi:hypothetical protein HZB01_05570 [Candidatus Woesearchaeota archaeon]|nr:hypothetical protein [Candidatus Woesearchaeota archaeon]